jgi:hypothetical protein
MTDQAPNAFDPAEARLGLHRRGPMQLPFSWQASFNRDHIIKVAVLVALRMRWISGADTPKLS